VTGIVKFIRARLRRDRRATLATVRATLATVRAERERAFLLLRVLNRYGAIPDGPLRRDVNRATALESESDIEDAQRAVDGYITDQLERGQP
jgi:hypothetical protein